MMHIVIWLLILALIIWINYRNMQAVGPAARPAYDATAALS